MSRALNEEVTWDDQKVTSIDWRTYRPISLGDEIPKIETVLINRPDSRAMGAGETAVTVTAAADVQAGQAKAIGFLVGQVMAKSKGQANPQTAQKLLQQRLSTE